MKTTALRILLFAVLISGCAETREICKGVLGVSTKALEEGRKDGIRKEFNFDPATLHQKVKQILKDSGSYIYCDKPEKDMLAIYVSEEDTTPVGVFFTGAGAGRTLVEVSSPSVYGKETIFRIINESLTTGITKPPQKGLFDAGKEKKEP